MAESKRHGRLARCRSGTVILRGNTATHACAQGQYVILTSTGKSACATSAPAPHLRVFPPDVPRCHAGDQKTLVPVQDSQAEKVSVEENP